MYHIPFTLIKENEKIEGKLDIVADTLTEAQVKAHNYLSSLHCEFILGSTIE